MSYMHDLSRWMLSTFIWCSFTLKGLIYLGAQVVVLPLRLACSSCPGFIRPLMLGKSWSCDRALWALLQNTLYRFTLWSDTYTQHGHWARIKSYHPYPMISYLAMVDQPSFCNNRFTLMWIYTPFHQWIAVQGTSTRIYVVLLDIAWLDLDMSHLEFIYFSTLCCSCVTTLDVRTCCYDQKLWKVSWSVIMS